MLALLALLLLGVATAFAWRLELAEAGLRHWLAANGFPDAEVSAAELGWRRLVLRQLDLGKGAPAADRVVVRYSIAGLARGAVNSVRVVAPRAGIDLDDPAPWLARLQRSGGDAGAGDAAPGIDAVGLPLKRLTIVGGELRVRGWGREARVDLDGQLELAGEKVTLELEGRAVAAGSRLSFTAHAEGPPVRPDVDLTVAGTLDAAAMPWPAASALRPEAGTLTLNGRYRGELAGLMNAADASTPERLPPGRMQLEVGLRDWRVDGLTESASGQLALRSEGAEGPVTVALREVVRIRSDAGADFWTALGLGPGVARELARTQRLALAEEPAAEPLLAVRPVADGWHADARFRLEAERADGSVTATVAASGRHDRRGRPVDVEIATLDLGARRLEVAGQRLGEARFQGRAGWGADGLSVDGRLQGRLARAAVGGHVLSDVGLEAPLSLRAGAGLDRASLGLADTGRLTVAALPTLGAARLEGPLEATLTAGEATLRDGVASGRLRLAPGTIAGVAAGPEGAATPFELMPGALELVFHRAGSTALRLIAEDTRLRLPAVGIVAEGFSADVSHAPPQGLSGRVTLGRLSQETESPAFAPMRLAAELAGTPARPRLEGNLRPAQGGPPIPFRLDHDVDTGSGALTFGPATLRFSPGDLAPEDLLPPLARLDNARGELRLEGRLPWGEGADAGQLRLALAEVDFDAAGVGVRGLATELELTSLLPPRSAPEQTLTVRELQAGPVLSDLRARFALAHADGSLSPVIELAALEGDFAGGSLRVEDARLDPGAERNAVTVGVADLALERLLRELGLGEDVTGEGRLSGRIPVQLTAAGPVIADGELQAALPGRLRVRLRETGEALGRQAQEMELMIRALEDFRYEVLRAELARDADGEVRLALRLEGHNPEVLEGHPFRFNISLTGNLDPVFRALRLGGDIGAGFLREHLRLQ